MTRSEIINSLIKRYGYRSYLEIGVNTPAQPGWNFDSVDIELKHGVDPEPATKATFIMPSDDFFNGHIKQRYDIVFVDGLHIFEQAYRDIINALAWLNDNGTIVVHDCNPVTEITQRRERASSVWHGDVWKAILKLRMEQEDIEIYTVDADEGCAIIRKGQQPLFTSGGSSEIFEYEFFDQHRSEILNLISPQKFQEKINYGTIVKIEGGLGNQMFQYATGRKMAMVNGTDLRLDISYFPFDHKRDYSLRHFNIRAIPVDSNNYITRRLGRLGLFNRLLKKTVGKYRRSKKLVTEQSPRFDDSIFSAGGDAYLDGYWQSEKYFSSIRRELLEDFQLRPEARESIDPELLADIESSVSVSLHIRRGDYISDSAANQYHGTLNNDYYSRAVKLMAEKEPDLKIFVFSDDPEWCRENISFAHKFRLVDQSRDYAALFLMSRCRHNIIANSTFSWWGAWLNEHPGKTVIAPQRWFRDQTADASDIIPAGWITL